MTLIKSISGIRGTLGGPTATNLTPVDIVKFAAAYGSWLQQRYKDEKEPLTVVVGRDARPSGPMVQELVQQTLVGLGIDVLSLGLSTTPTVAMAVPAAKAHGGIVLTASHNPIAWNALKLLNARGEFINAQDGQEVLALAAAEAFDFAPTEALGRITSNTNAITAHIDAILALEEVNVPAIAAAGLKVVVDGVHSTGGIAIPQLLEALGVAVIPMYCEPHGQFPHNPEPLPEHLEALSKAVVAQGADFGIVVDPDVDRLAFVDEHGAMFGEEYTLVACADYILSKTPGATVSNLSSTAALKIITEKHGGKYFAAAVGEVNVVTAMKKHQAVIGGEGNGGVIFPKLHYGRDALVGVALFLSHLVAQKQSVSQLRASYPNFYMSKNKATLPETVAPQPLLDAFQKQYAAQDCDTTDGLKITFEDHWVHLRKSNTEPIVRVYTEAPSQEQADTLSASFVRQLEEQA